MYAIEDWNEDEVVTVGDLHFDADSDGAVRVSLHAVNPQRMIRFRIQQTHALPLFLKLKAAMNTTPSAKESPNDDVGGG